MKSFLSIGKFEAFFTGSATEVTPISTIDDIPIADGKPGPVTLELKETYLNIIHGKHEKYDEWLTYIDHVKNNNTIFENSEL